ncbi:MAG: hypothetical protein HYU69_06500 [Bacteroidetes bacterium]|nr:hypothetical protein [Bacteroidota bacterium]
MNNSKLIELYKSLDSIEKRRFREYIESPFFNSNNSVVKLNRYILDSVGADKDNEPDKIRAYYYLFGKENYNDQKIRDVMSFLMRHLEAFVSYLKFEKDELLQKELLMVELRERNLDKHFISNTNEYLKKIQEKKLNDSDYFYERYTLEGERDHYFMTKEVRKSNESLQQKSDSLDAFYLSEKLHSLCEMVNRKNIIAANYNLNMLDELLAYISKHIKIFQSIPAIYIYYKILLSLLEEEVPQHFIELKHSLEKHFKEFSKDEARQMFDYAQNYCIKKINNGKQEYVKEIFSIYESLLESEIIFVDKYLSQWDYKNIVSIGVKLEKYDWTKTFIEKYKDRIAPEFRQNAYEYNLAVYYYNKKDYKSALKLLQRVEFTDVYYHIGAKSMLLKIYYEMNEVEPFYSLIDAYKIYLVRNKKISIYQRKGHQHLVKYTRQAFDLKLRNSSASNTAYEKAVKKLKSRIITNQNDANLTWLLERVEEL